MAVKGIGAQRARMIWEALDIATLEGLACAAMEHRLCRLPGIGETLEGQVLSELERIDQAAERACSVGAAPTFSIDRTSEASNLSC